MTKHARRAGFGALALAATLGLAGCADDGDTGGMGGMDHGSAAPAASPTGPTSPSPTGPSSAAPAGAKTPAAGPQNDADVMFAQGMVPHHEQAVEMSDLILSKPDADPRVLDLARQIKAAQAPEITRMTGWLEGWGFTVMDMDDGMDHTGHAGSGMDGMMSEEDMDALEAARGADASTLFLEGMVEHHEGAVEMARTEISDGENPEAVELARTIEASQQQEITAMRDLLARL